MALECTASVSGEPVNLSAIISSFNEEFGDPPDKPLLDAVQGGELHAVRKASDSLQGQSFLRPKQIAIELGRPDLLRCLLESDSLVDRSLIETACIFKDQASILTLLDFGWQINEPLNPDQYVLWAAVEDIEFARFLVNIGADVNCRSRYNASALSLAIAYGSIDVVHFLISQGADITHGDLLHCAARRDDQLESAELVEELAQKGADVNAHSFDNAAEAPFRKLRTPLHVAVEHNNIPAAKALLRHGADPNGMCTQACELTEPTVLQEAIHKGSERLIKLLTVGC